MSEDEPEAVPEPTPNSDADDIQEETCTCTANYTVTYSTNPCPYRDSEGKTPCSKGEECPACPAKTFPLGWNYIPGTWSYIPR